MRNRIRFKSRIFNTTTIHNSSILQEINIVQDELSKAIIDVNEDFFEEQKNKFNLVANCSLYALPTDHVKFKQLRVSYSAVTDETNYKVCESYDPTEVGVTNVDEENVPASNPIVDITNNYLRIMPRPGQNVTNGGSIYYIARPSALANTGDTTVIPTEYQELMTIGAASRVAESFENFNLSDRLDVQYERGIQKMKEQLAARELNRDLRFRDVRETNKSNRAELPG